MTSTARSRTAWPTSCTDRHGIIARGPRPRGHEPHADRPELRPGRARRDRPARRARQPPPRTLGPRVARRCAGLPSRSCLVSAAAKHRAHICHAPSRLLGVVVSPVLLSDAARVGFERASAARPDLRTDAMLLSHGRAGTEPLVAAAMLIDAVRTGHLDVLEGRRIVAGRSDTREPIPLAELRARVLNASPGSPLTWIERTAEFASRRVATELITAGIA